VKQPEAVNTDMRPAVIVRPASAHSFEHEDFQALVLEVVRETGLMADQVEVRLHYLYGDWAEPGWTWVEFILNEAGKAAVTSVANAIMIWGAIWIRKARRRDPAAAPIKAVIYGPDGEVLREVEVPSEEK
jgi:hypothetical protein